jgi:hypothetical protein
VQSGTSSDNGESFSGLAAGTTYKIGVSGIINGVETQITSRNFTTASPAPAPTPTPTTTTAAPPPPSASGVPVAGNWTLAFGDEFNGTAVDTSKWRTNWYAEGGVMNKVGTYARNATVANGELSLKLESTSAGALIHTDFSGGYKLPVGSYVEARAFFPTSGSVCANWPAWWANPTAADKWPSSGEHDIAEVLSGQLTVNYHSPSGAHNQGAVPGTWCGAYHTYGLHRKAGSADVYWDGVKVKSYSTDDSGKPEILILNMGIHSSNTVIGASLKVDYVRAYTPAP